MCIKKRKRTSLLYKARLIVIIFLTRFGDKEGIACYFLWNTFCIKTDDIIFLIFTHSASCFYAHPILRSRTSVIVTVFYKEYFLFV